jgi:hypothetical protein
LGRKQKFLAPATVLKYRVTYFPNSYLNLLAPKAFIKRSDKELNVPPKKSGTVGNAGSGIMGSVRLAIDAIGQLAKQAMEKDAAPSVRILALSIVVMIVVVFVAAALISTGHPNLALALCCIAIAVQVLTIVTFSFYHKGLTGVQDVPMPLKEWRRTVPNWKECPEERQIKLGLKLETVRNEALEFLRKQHPDLKNEHVRGAIFLPQFDAVDKAVACMLYIPAQLRKQLYHKDEWDLELHPGEGVSGDVFLNNKPRIESRTYGMWNPAKLNSTHPDLKWIVGLPLNHAGRTMGALNVDGLVSDCDQTLLARMIELIQPLVDDIASSLSELPQAKVNIRVDQV